MKPLALTLLVLVLVLTLADAADDRRIVPGERIGNIKLGMAHAGLLELLGAPHRQDDLEFAPRRGKVWEGLREKTLKRHWRALCARIGSRPSRRHADRMNGLTL